MEDELCPKRDGKGKHCWHGNAVMLLSDPPIRTQTCCFCGITRHEPGTYNKDLSNHGPYLVRKTWHQSE